ncbi:MAG: transporter substrate-binding domain-containing protein [Pirellulales bacterium]
MNGSDGRWTRRSWIGGVAAVGCAIAALTGSVQAEPGGAAAAATGGSGPRVLKVAVMPIAPVVEWTAARPTGAMIDIWNEFAQRLGVTSEFVRVNTFLELMKIAEDGKVDVALGPLAITEERERILDLTHPIVHSGLRIAVRQKNDTGFMAAIRGMLSWRLLQLVGVVLALGLVSGHLLWWFEKGHNPRSFPEEYPRGVIEAMWWIVSTIVTGGCDDKHVDGPLGRLIAFLWMIGGMGLIATFTSVLTSTMTADKVTGVIHGPRDLTGRVVGCQAAGVTVQTVRQRGGLPQEYTSMRDAIAGLEMGMVEAVVGESETLMYLVNELASEDVKIVGPMFESFDYGLALPNRSPFRESLNAVILQTREDGTITRIRENLLGKHD